VGRNGCGCETETSLAVIYGTIKYDIKKFESGKEMVTSLKLFNSVV